jgi:RNA polymerase sigma factor (sigma-70 family)
MMATAAASDFNAVTDRDLIVACQNGQETAWDALVARYEELVYTVLDRYMLEWPEEGVIFQSVWLSLLKNLDSVRRTNRVGAWLAAATRSELRRKRQKETGRNGNGSRPAINKWGYIDHDDQALEDIVSRYSRYQATCRAVTRLDVQSQQLHKMLFRESTTPPDEEIAAKLNVPIGSVEQLSARVHKKLRQMLADFT